MPRHRKKLIDSVSMIVILFLVALDLTTWRAIWSDMVARNKVAQIYFLSVTQGESALLVLPNGTTVLTDAGSDGDIVDDLQKISTLGGTAYIDLAIISYPQAADYEGYEYLLQHDHIGAFLYNGRADMAHAAEWQDLLSIIRQKNIPLITIGAGDVIRFGNADDTSTKIDILSPDEAFARSPDPQDTAIVQHITTPNFTALLAADIGANGEKAFLARKTAITAEILEEPLPGFESSAGNAFLNAVMPKTIVITPGIKGTASAPTTAILARLASSTSATIAMPGHDAFLLYNK